MQEEITQKKKKRKLSPQERAMRIRTLAYVWMAVAMLAMLVTFSFAWFSVSTTPRVSEMSVNINSPSGLEISESYDARDEEWGQSISFANLVSSATPLKPVTWSESEQCFKAARYGRDGRLLSNWKTLSDSANANGTGSDQYYVYGTFYARSESACNVSLADAVELNNGLNGSGTYVMGNPVWDSATNSHYNAGQGSEYAVRIGFRVTQVDPDTGTAVGGSEFYIYEPNADSHLDGTEQIIDTASIDGTDTLVDSSHMIVQTTSSWSETSPTQRDATIKSLGTFVGDSTFFTVEAGETYRIDMYIWIDGQDVDCYGLPEDTELIANIQFNADYTQQSGLVDIDDNN
jgi:hypothetical protein